MIIVLQCKHMQFSYELLWIWSQDTKTSKSSISASSSQTQTADGGETLYDLQIVTMDILRFLSSLTTLYAAPSQDAQEKDTVEV